MFWNHMITLSFEIEKENIGRYIMKITLFEYDILITFKFIQIKTITAASWKGDLLTPLSK